MTWLQFQSLYLNSRLLFLWRIKEKVGKKKIRPRRAGVFPDGSSFFTKAWKKNQKRGFLFLKTAFSSCLSRRDHSPWRGSFSLFNNGKENRTCKEAVNRLYYNNVAQRYSQPRNGKGIPGMPPVIPCCYCPPLLRTRSVCGYTNRHSPLTWSGSCSNSGASFLKSIKWSTTKCSWLPGR